MNNKQLFLINDQNSIFKLSNNLLEKNLKKEALIERNCLIFEEFSSLREELKINHGFIDFEIDCMPIFLLDLAPHGNIILSAGNKLIDFGDLDPNVLLSHFESKELVFRDDDGLILNISY